MRSWTRYIKLRLTDYVMIYADRRVQRETFFVPGYRFERLRYLIERRWLAAMCNFEAQISTFSHTKEYSTSCMHFWAEAGKPGRDEFPDLEAQRETWISSYSFWKRENIRLGEDNSQLCAVEGQILRNNHTTGTCPCPSNLWVEAGKPGRDDIQDLELQREISRLWNHIWEETEYITKGRYRKDSLCSQERFFRSEGRKRTSVCLVPF